MLKLTVTSSGLRTYAITLHDREETKDYEGYASMVKGTPLLNLHEASTRQRWQFVTYALLQPDVLRIRLVSDRLLKGVPRTAIRKAIEEQRGNSALYEESVVCVRLV